MRRVSIAVLAVLVPLLGSSVAQADRPYTTRPEVARPEPEHVPFTRPEVSRNEHVGSVRCVTDCGREHQVVTIERAERPAIRPDARRDAFVPVDETGTRRGLMGNREVSQGKPALRPDAKRDAFVPVNEETGRPRALNPNREVRHGKPALRPDAKRDAFVPVDEVTGRKRPLNATHEVSQGKPALRPDVKRETFRPAQDEMGTRDEIHRILCHVSAQCGGK